MGKVESQLPFERAEPDFHGAAIIDDQGREIPITESMIQHACAVLERTWRSPWAGLPALQRR